MPLSESQIRRYSRHIVLPDIGGVGQQRLLEARVSVAVTDGDGAAVAALAYLAAAGVGTLIVTGDPQELVTGADVRGGILYGQRDIGRPRLDALTDRLRAINPDVTVQTHSQPDLDLVLDQDQDQDQVCDLAGALVVGGRAALELIARVARGERS